MWRLCCEAEVRGEDCRGEFVVDMLTCQVFEVCSFRIDISGADIAWGRDGRVEVNVRSGGYVVCGGAGADVVGVAPLGIVDRQGAPLSLFEMTEAVTGAEDVECCIDMGLSMLAWKTGPQSFVDFEFPQYVLSTK